MLKQLKSATKAWLQKSTNRFAVHWQKTNSLRQLLSAQSELVSRSGNRIRLVGDDDMKRFQLGLKNDTVFILGGGASINEISSAEWKELHRSTTLGMNFWPVHDFVPDYYSFETRSINDEVMQSLQRLIKYRASDFRRKNTVFLLKRIHSFHVDDVLQLLPVSLYEQLFLPNTMWMPPVQSPTVARMKTCLQREMRRGRPSSVEARTDASPEKTTKKTTDDR